MLRELGADGLEGAATEGIGHALVTTASAKGIGVAAPTASASLRALVAYEASRAGELLAEGGPLIASVHGRLRLLLAGFVGGGRAALAAVTDAGYDVLPGPPRPTKPRLLREVGAALRGER